MKTNIWQQFTEATTEANESENEDWEEANVVANQWESQKLIKNVPESTWMIIACRWKLPSQCQWNCNINFSVTVDVNDSNQCEHQFHSQRHFHSMIL